MYVCVCVCVYVYVELYIHILHTPSWRFDTVTDEGIVTSEV